MRNAATTVKFMGYKVGERLAGVVVKRRGVLFVCLIERRGVRCGACMLGWASPTTIGAKCTRCSATTEKIYRTDSRGKGNPHRMNTDQRAAEPEQSDRSATLKFREDERWRWQRRMILNLSTLPLMSFDEAVAEADEYILGRRAR